jgi:superoxide reductase
MMQTKEKFGELFQAADWTKEKHVPVIDCPATAKKGEMLSVNVTIGKEIAHPNTTQHHIDWIEVFFQPQGEKYPYSIGRFEFRAHGSSVKGADTSTVYTHHEGTLKFKTDVPGTLFASSYCNIHGLWQNSKELNVD